MSFAIASPLADPRQLVEAALTMMQPGRRHIVPRASEDFCNQTGALKLAERIRAYWAERGYIVKVYTPTAGYTAPMRSMRYDVRSDMVGGQPRAASHA